MKKTKLATDPAAAHTERFLTTRQLAERWQVCSLTLRRWRKAGRLPTLFLGRGTRFALEDVERIESEARVTPLHGQ